MINLLSAGFCHAYILRSPISQQEAKVYLFRFLHRLPISLRMPRLCDDKKILPGAISIRNPFAATNTYDNNRNFVVIKPPASLAKG
ncbi:hypothetical protein [Terrimonas alba]|uniref:hypothetical protein n=1 Tax=Terrimonas alba TaxID=3349636 RepID=UPI0035F25A1D